jgi:predicted dehydrogenase
VLRSVVIGLGRSGAGLHVPVLHRLRAGSGADGLFAAAPLVGYDPLARPVPGVALARELAELGRLVEPAAAVVHLCTPPPVRVELLDRLSRLGFRRYVVEKPLVSGEPELAELERLRQRASLDIVVVSHWLSSRLAVRLAALLSGGTLGELRTIRVVQRKPRFTRALAGGPTSVFDIEIPHAVGLALLLAGSATVRAAGCADLHCGPSVVAGMGGGWLSLQHAGGVRTDIRCDLTAPSRQRSVTLSGTRGTAVGHFPVSADDAYAQLRLPGRAPEVFADDALAGFLHDAYRHFAGVSRLDNLALNADVVRLLDRARRLAGTAATVQR